MRAGASARLAPAVADPEVDGTNSAASSTSRAMRRVRLDTVLLLYLAALQGVEHIKHELERIRLHRDSAERVIDFQDQPEAPEEQHSHSYRHQPVRTRRLGEEDHAQTDRDKGADDQSEPEHVG